MARPMNPFKPHTIRTNVNFVFETADLLADPDTPIPLVSPVTGPEVNTSGTIGFNDGGGLNWLRSAPIGGAVTPSSSRLMTTYTSGAVGKYNVAVHFDGVSNQSTGGWTSAMQQVIVSVSERISKLIVGDLPPVVVNGRKVDDMQITAMLTDIDGAGGILGQAGMTAIRPTSLLPYTGVMRFDTADVQRYLATGLFDEIVTHEMLTCVGYGTLWKAKGLVAGTNFIGPHTVAAYNDLVDEYAATHGGSMTLANGTVLVKDLIPLEIAGGAGTAGQHWSENVFNTELMTGFLDSAAANGSVVAPLSAMTMASLRDLGYMTGDAGATDAFRLI